jgi:hypothetical protein
MKDRVLLQRREFLALGSVAMAGVAASSLSGQVLRAALAPARVVPLLSVGYFAGSIPDLAAGGAGRVISAESLSAGDGSLAESGIRLRIHGLSRAAGRQPEAGMIGLNTLYRIGNTRVPQLSWSCSTSAKGVQQAVLASFVVPVDAGSPLELAVSSRALQSVAAASFAGTDAARHDLGIVEANGRSIAAFSLGAARGAMKLRRGTYLLALRSSQQQRQPDWLSIRFAAPSEGAAPLLLQGGAPVSFDYLTLSVEPVTLV